MVAAILAHWKAATLATGAILLSGYIGVLNVQLASERAVTARLDADLRSSQLLFNACKGSLENIRERIKSDATVPDDLGGFTPKPEWMLP